MSIQHQVTEAMKSAMKNKETEKLQALRLIRADLLKKLKESGREELSDEEAVQILQSMAKQRRDSIEQFEKGGRDDLVQAEKAELAVIEGYLPAPVDEGEIDRIIDEAVAESGAASMKDMGRVMGVVMKKAKELEGTLDGSMVNRKVRDRLS
jgi:uncharacterized protein